jgi:23S rRNA (guanosine2251-2'-O)-methyltransferase
MQTIKGKHAVLEALRSNIVIERIMISYAIKTTTEVKEIMGLAKKNKIKIQTAPNSFFQNNFPDETNTQGILAYVQDKKLLDLSDILNNKNKYKFVLALDHIEDPFNFGAIIRTSEIFGVNAIIFPKDRSCQITSGVIKVSSGAINNIDLIKVVNIAQSLEKLSNNGYWLYGADSNNGEDLDRVEPNAPLVIVMGNEHKGISTRVLKMLHLKLKIPTIGKTASLNVSVATGIILNKFMKNIYLDV